MAETHPHPKRPLVTGTWNALLILIGLILIGMAVGSILGAALVVGIMGDGSFLSELALLDNTIEYDPQKWFSVISFQGIVHLSMFLIPSLIYWMVIERKTTSAFYLKSRDSYRDLVPIFFLTVALMPFTGLVAEWNQNMKFPDALYGIELWMQEKEEALAGLTEYLMSFQNYGELFIAIVVIAVIPAVGEEVLFRGILQRKLAEHWANVHLAIWVSAFVFSTIHFQFYGFFPRLFLGAMFGYLYFWTGRLGMAIFAHFINNAVTVTLMWMHKKDMIGINIASTDTIPLWMGLLSLVISVSLLRVVYRASPESVKA